MAVEYNTRAIFCRKATVGCFSRKVSPVSDAKIVTINIIKTIANTVAFRNATTDFDHLIFFSTSGSFIASPDKQGFVTVIVSEFINDIPVGLASGNLLNFVGKFA